MDPTVEQKYNNFRDRIISHNKLDSTYELAFKATSVQTFLTALDQYKETEPNDLLEIICKTFSVNLDDYEKEEIQIFKRYIEYFKKVNKKISQ